MPGYLAAQVNDLRYLVHCHDLHAFLQYRHDYTVVNCGENSNIFDRSGSLKTYM
jgi:hypothetical protein